VTGYQSDSAGFYGRLAPCETYEAVGDIGRFHPLPDDWYVVVADIRDSTPAIAAGRYKDVNMIGAACIVATLNAVPNVDIPFVFGGDGATLALPRALLQPITAILRQTRALAAAELGFDLRVGAVAVGDLRARGEDVLAAKLRVGDANYLAMFAGGGVALADRLIKDDFDGTAGYAIVAPAEGTPDLEGLSCRWEPLASMRGRMVNLLVRATAIDVAAAAQVYRDVVAALDEIMAADPLAGRPVRQENMRLRWPPRGLGLEAGLTRGGGSKLARLCRIGLQSFIQGLLERFDLSAGDYNAPVYRAELRQNTDYRRFDGTLRLVLDCSDEELHAITALLDRMHDAGTICYGLHTAGSALMTCVVFNLAEKRHLHFVDGVDGGFAVAAKGLKAQLAERSAGARGDS